MPVPPKPDPIKFCRVCGKQLHRKRYNGRLEDMGVFLRRQACSQSCANSLTRVQADSFRWRARQIMERTACTECGSTEHLHVHHRDRDVTNNDPSNLEVLCASCHLRLHWREDRDARMESISAHTRTPLSDGRRYLDGPPLHLPKWGREECDACQQSSVSS